MTRTPDFSRPNGRALTLVLMASGSTTRLILSVTFEVNAEDHRDGQFSVPRTVCRALGLRPRDRIRLVITTPRMNGNPLEVIQMLASGTEIHGREIEAVVRAGDRLHVIASHP